MREQGWERMASEMTYIRLNKRQKQIIRCIKEKLGHTYLSETIRYLIDKGLDVVRSDFRECWEADKMTDRQAGVEEDGTGP